MIEVDSLLRCPDGSFVPLGACDTPPRDSDYIEGAIRLVVDSREILGLNEWDYVDRLWSYIAHMIRKLRTSSNADTYFPDQPLKHSFRVVGTRIIVTVGHEDDARTASVPTEVFLHAVRTAGPRFFDKMTELAPTKSYTHAKEDLLA